MEEEAGTAVPESARTTGLLASLRRLLATAAEILQTRLELLSVELEEEGLRLRELLLYALVALFFLGFGLLLLTLLIVVVFWDTHRLPVLGGITALYLAIGIGAALRVRHTFKTRPRLFAATLAEIGKDREQLTPRA
jgi:uncharacterized membrane protein YqjE